MQQQQSVQQQQQQQQQHLGSGGGGGSSSSSTRSGGGGSALPAAVAALLTCRLTGRLLCDPVIAEDGFTYEREALLVWLQQRDPLSPATGRRLGPTTRPNFAIRELLAASLD